MTTGETFEGSWDLEILMIFIENLVQILKE